MTNDNSNPKDKLTASNESDSEEDEDYVPPAEEGGDDEEGDSDEKQSKEQTIHSAPILSLSKQKEVDDAFMELFGKPYRYQEKEKKELKDLNRTSQGAISKRRKILSDIFGGTGIASKLMETSKETIENDAMSRKRKIPLGQLNRKDVTEKIKFAGQTMEIQRSVVVVGNETQQQQQSQEGPLTDTTSTSKAAVGIDAVLSQIKGPQKFTTIDKTNVDWEKFKDKAGIEEELKKKAQSKDAYLVKKDFLNRVDVRRFEQERDERNKKRAAAALGNNSNK